jgi:peptidoglycan/LPS O-acetylase OafA/YrhL
MEPDRTNNFDLIRLVAALQVMYSHSTEHLRVQLGGDAQFANAVIGCFPGVPIFFVVSGFLISSSYERSADLRSYARNRFLRVYPALWMAFLASILLLIACHALTEDFVLSPTFLAWIGAQLTCFQFFNPAALRSFGVGVVNGSLWTIPVELQFYAVLPLLYWALRRATGTARDAAWIALGSASFVVSCALGSHLSGGGIAAKLLQVTVFPHLYLFVIGVLTHRYYRLWIRCLNGKAAYWVVAYLAVRWVEHWYLGPTTNGLPPWGLAAGALTATWTILLGVSVISAAFTSRQLATRLLRKNDLSYGVYLCHMLVVNALVYVNWIGTAVSLMSAAAITLALAMLSWVMVERPALRLKRAVIAPQPDLAVEPC